MHFHPEPMAAIAAVRIAMMHRIDVTAEVLEPFDHRADSVEVLLDIVVEVTDPLFGPLESLDQFPEVVERLVGILEMSLDLTMEVRRGLAEILQSVDRSALVVASMMMRARGGRFPGSKIDVRGGLLDSMSDCLDADSPPVKFVSVAVEPFQIAH